MKSLLETMTEVFDASRFPETKYMGSKQAILPFIKRHLCSLRFHSVLDGFSGSGCVSYLFKTMGKQVTSNDYMEFCFHIANGVIANNTEVLTEDDIKLLLRENSNADTFIRETFSGMYFDDEDNKFLDEFMANLNDLANPWKKSLALACICRACMKKRPRGIFTFTGKKGWDGRRDLKIPMRQQFIEAVRAYNRAIFDNGQHNVALQHDIFDLDPAQYDLVYLDPPYVSNFSDSDYCRRYHFVEGLCSYWKRAVLLPETKNKRIASRLTDFNSKRTIVEAFHRLFNHFRHSILVVSYSSNGVPSKSEIISMLKEYKRDVECYQIDHKYSSSTHSHKRGNGNNHVLEYLFIAR